MDVPVPWYALTTETCSGEGLRCAGGDVACRERAAQDGYVAVSLYQLCRKEDVHTVPLPFGAVLIVATLAVAVVAARRALRARKRQS